MTTTYLQKLEEEWSARSNEAEEARLALMASSIDLFHPHEAVPINASAVADVKRREAKLKAAEESEAAAYKRLISEHSRRLERHIHA